MSTSSPTRRRAPNSALAIRLRAMRSLVAKQFTKAADVALRDYESQLVR